MKHMPEEYSDTQCNTPWDQLKDKIGNMPPYAWAPILIQRVRDVVWFPTWFIDGLLEWNNTVKHSGCIIGEQTVDVIDR